MIWGVGSFSEARSLAMTKTWIAIGLALCAAAFGQAQVQRGASAIDEIGLESGKPFTAEKVMSRVVTDADGTERVTNIVSIEYVTRDSSGRLRVERQARPATPGQSEEEIARLPRLIAIFDPARGSITRMDAQKKHATIDAIRESGNPGHHPFSAAYFPAPGAKVFPNYPFTDLWYKTIEGVEVHGGRTTQLEPGDPPVPVTVVERWYSDDLAAVVVEVNTTVKNGMATRVALVHIKRGEPDLSLFEIPKDCNVDRDSTGTTPAVRVKHQ
jgi:hypothetical protein